MFYQINSKISINLNNLFFLLVVAQQILHLGLRFGSLLILQTQQVTQLTHLDAVSDSLDGDQSLDLLNRIHGLPSDLPTLLWHFGTLHRS